MFRKEISPKTAALATLAILAAIQLVYWRLLVYQPVLPVGPDGGGGGGAGPGAPALGRADVTVETLAGGEPGYRDGLARDARFAGPNAIAAAPDGTLFVADSRNHRIRRISPAGRVSTEAGGGQAGGPGGRADGPAADARFRYPSGVAAAPDGTLFVADTGNHRVCRLRNGRVTTLAGGPADRPGRQDGTGSAAAFHFPAALFLDGGGTLWVADAGNRAVRRVDPAGAVTTPAEVPGPVAEALGDLRELPRSAPVAASSDGKGMPEVTQHRTGRDSAGARDGALRVFADSRFHVLLAARGGEPPVLLAGRRVGDGSIIGSGDGAGTHASFALPCSVARGADGAFYVTDFEGNRIRRVLLPSWLLQGEEAPLQPRRRFGRGTRGG